MKFENSPLRKVLERAGETDRKKSVQWFLTEANKLNLNNPRQVMTSEIGQLTWNFKVGDLIMFYYDAKTKDNLPYWDRFPLVFPFSFTATGFTGINFHYLPPLLRVQLLEQLMTLKNSPTITDTTRLKLSWQLLKRAAKHRLIKPCVKQYLMPHVMSRFMKIPAPDWKMAILLPVERFQKKTSAEVYRDLKLTR